MNQRMRAVRAYSALVFAAGSWGVATATAKYAVGPLGAFTTLIIELGASMLVLWPAAAMLGVGRSVPLRSYLLLGLVEPTVAYGALDLGLQRTSAGDAALLDGLQSVIVLVLGLLILKEAVTRRSVLGVLVATIGGGLLAGAHPTARAMLGDSLVLLGSLAASYSVILVSRIAERASALELTVYQFGVGFVFTLPLAVIAWSTGAESVPTTHDLPYVLAAAGVGLVGFGAGYLLYNYAVAHVPVGVAGMALNLIPLFGVGTAVLALSERLDAWELVGGALIVAGVALFPYETKEIAEGAEEGEGEAVTVGRA